MRGLPTRRRVFGSAIHAALLFVTVGLTACSPLDDAMVAVFGRSMRDQSSFDPYENTIPAPEGSVPFAAGNWTPGPGRINIGQPEAAGSMPLPMVPADLLQQNPVIMELENPVEATPESLARGEVLYLRYCAVCHGEAGIGTEAYITDDQLAAVLAAYNLSGETAAAYPDGYIYGIIRVGRGLMPSYAHAITHYDRWNVVNYVRQLQQNAGTLAGSAASGPADQAAAQGAGE